MAAPLIETGDVTGSGSNTATDVPDPSYPAYESGDLLVQYLMIDDDDTITPPATGPNSETRTIIGTGDSGSASGPAIAAMWWLGTASRIAGTQTWSLSNTEQWVGKCIKVLAAELNSSTPVDSVSGIDGASVNGNDVPTPAWSGTASGGRVVVGVAINTQDLGGVATGWTEVQHTDIGAVSGGITTRDAETTSSESIATVNHTTSNNTSSTLGLVINGPAAGANPKGPLGMPLHGPFGGPIG